MEFCVKDCFFFFLLHKLVLQSREAIELKLIYQSIVNAHQDGVKSNICRAAIFLDDWVLLAIDWLQSLSRSLLKPLSIILGFLPKSIQLFLKNTKSLKAQGSNRVRETWRQRITCSHFLQWFHPWKDMLDSWTYRNLRDRCLQNCTNYNNLNFQLHFFIC